MNTLTKALEAMKGVCGIYRMTNTQTGKFYIGSSVDIRNRWYKHLSHLRRGIHANAHLQAAFTQSGEDAFLFELVEACEPGALLALEQYHIDALGSGKLKHYRGYTLIPAEAAQLAHR